MRSSSESPWGALIEAAPLLVERLKRAGCRRVRLVVDGEVVYWGLLVPEEALLEAHGRFPGMPQWTLKDWLLDTLRRFEAGWPQAKTVELLGVWPEHTERLARVFPKGGVPTEEKGALPSEEIDPC